MERERKFLHSTLGEWGHPRTVPSAGACSTEEREPEDKAAGMVGRAEEEEEGVGVSASRDSCPCTALLLPETQSFPGQSQGHVLSTACPCHSFSHCPGALQPGQSRYLGFQVQCWQPPAPPHCPLCPPRDGADTAERELPAHPASPAASPAAPITPSALGRVPEDSTSCRSGGPAAGSPLLASLPRQPPGLSVLFRASHKHSRDI